MEGKSEVPQFLRAHGCASKDSVSLLFYSDVFMSNEKGIKYYLVPVAGEGPKVSPLLVHLHSVYSAQSEYQAEWKNTFSVTVSFGTKEKGIIEKGTLGK